MKKLLLAAAILVVLTSLIFLHCTKNIAGGTEVGNPSVSAMLYNPGGTPAAHATVRFYPVNYNPRTGGLGKILATAATVDSAITDSNGNYAAKLNTGTYNVLATGDSGVVYQDSIKVVKDSTINPPTDTLKAPGSLRGVIRLQPGDDARKVFIIVMGTNTLTEPQDSVGNFTLANMAQGSYNVRILSVLDNYGVLDTSLAVRAGKNDTLADTIVLPFTGIPIPTGLKISYDTARQIVTLTWNKEDSALVKGYNVYRRNVDSSFGQTPINGTTLVRGTVYRDSTGIQDQSYEYKVVSIDKGDNAGKFSGGTTIKVVTNIALIDSVPQLKPVDRFAIGPDSLFYGVYIGDSFVRVFNRTGDSIRVIGSGDLNSPTDVAVDSRGRIYAVSSNGINKYAADGTTLGHWAVTQPVYLAIDSNNYLYVIYNNGHTIAKEDSTGRIVDSVQVQSAVEIVASASRTVFVGDGICQCIHVVDTSLVTISSTEFRVGTSGSPNIMAIDTKGRLYTRDVVDFGGQGVLEVHIFDAQGTFVAKFQPSRGGDDIHIFGNTIYLVDRNLGLSTYRLPF
ncbi:MAG TPA: hypothetical protein VLX68_17485 [Chitinivibrionales bacterium]|nr:hypothetical protein [Chitinivibrionales bacterium]